MFERKIDATTRIFTYPVWDFLTKLIIVFIRIVIYEYEITYNMKTVALTVLQLYLYPKTLISLSAKVTRGYRISKIVALQTFTQNHNKKRQNHIPTINVWL